MADIQEVQILEAQSIGELEEDVNTAIDELEVGDEAYDIKYAVEVDIIQTKPIRTYSAMILINGSA